MAKPQIRVIEEYNNILTIKGKYFSKTRGSVYVSDVSRIQNDSKLVAMKILSWNTTEIVVLKEMGKFDYFQVVYIHIEAGLGEKTNYGYPLIFR